MHKRSLISIITELGMRLSGKRSISELAQKLELPDDWETPRKAGAVGSVVSMNGEEKMKRSLDCLAVKDQKIDDALRKHGYPSYSKLPEGDLMDLVKAIISQQISVEGAKTIYSKVENWLLNDELPPPKESKGKKGSSSMTLETEIVDVKRRKLEYGVFSTGARLERTDLQICDKILASSEEQFTLISLGNANKGKAVRSLAEHVKKGSLVISELKDADNAEVSKNITQVYGLGQWSADMYLIFTLGRSDVWPVGDEAMVRGLALIYGKSLEGMKTAAKQKWAREKGGEFPPEHLSSLARLCYRYYDRNKPSKKK